MKTDKTTSTVFPAIVLLTATIFILDSLTPLGVAVWLLYLYLLPLLVSTRAGKRWYPTIVATICTGMIVLGFFLSPPGVSVKLALLNRAMGISVLWVTTLLLERRQHAEAALRRERSLLERITETSPVAITVVDREGQITFANRRAEVVLGLARDEITRATYNAPTWRITDYEGGPLPHEQLPFRRVMDTGQAVFGVRHAIEWPDGRRVLLSINAAPLLDADGRVDGMVAALEDVTERVRAEALLAAEQHCLELVSTRAPLGEVLNAIVGNIEALSHDSLGSILLLDPDGVHVHHGAASNLPEAYIRALDGSEIGPAAGSCGTAAYRQAPVIVTDIETDPLWDDYRELARAHGLRACWATPIIDADGRVLGTFAMYYRQPRSPGEEDFRLIERATHIAGIAIERKQAEASLRESEEKFSKAFHSNPAMLVLATLDGRNVDVNQTFADFLGYSQEEIIGKSVVDLQIVSVEERQKVLELIQRSDGSVRNAEVVVRVRDGSLRHIVLSADVISLSGVPHRLVTLLDITDRQRAEEALRRNEQVLRLFVQHSPAAIAMFDRDMKYVVASHRYLMDYDLGEQSVIGRSHYEVFPEMPERWKEIHRRCLAGAVEKCDEDPFPRADGRLDWVRWEIRPWHEATGEIGGIILFSEVITARRQAEESIRDYADRLQSLSRDLLAVQERERRHIATELHDEIGQLLTGLKLTIEMGRSLPPHAAAASLDEAQSMVADLMTKVRDLSLELRPSMLDDLGLLPTLLWHFERYTNQTGVEVDFKQTGLDRRHSFEVETAAYRIVQEALTNVARYAGVSEVGVRLRADEDRMHLLIEDHGAGFDMDTVLAARATVGLAGMRERATLLGGNLTVESRPGEGTRVEGEVPM